MPLVDENDQQLKTPEEILAYANRRSDGSGSNSGQSLDYAKRISSFNEAPRGAISSSPPDSSREYGRDGAEKTSIYGRNGSIESGTGRPTFTLNRSSDYQEQSSGYSGSNDKPLPADARTGSKPKSAYQRLKEGFKPVAEAFKAPPTKVVESNNTKKAKSGASPSHGRKLTDTEIVLLRPKFIEYILWQSEHMDQLIIATTKGHNFLEIWANIDRDEAEVLADYFLKLGKVNERAAAAVRYMSDFITKIKVGVILLPRAYKTLVTYIERGFSISLH